MQNAVKYISYGPPQYQGKGQPEQKTFISQAYLVDQDNHSSQNGNDGPTVSRMVRTVSRAKRALFSNEPP